MNQKRFLIVAVIIIIGLVSYFVLIRKLEPVQQSAQSPSSPTPSQTTKLDTASWKYWRTSKDHYVVKVPSDWKVSQTDAGGFSVVSISSLKNLDINPDLTVSLEGAANFLGENKISFTAWVSNGGSKDSMSKPSITSSQNISLGGLSIMSQIENSNTMAYYADLGTDTYLGIRYSIINSQKNILGAIVTTFNFKPTQAQLYDASIIP